MDVWSLTITEMPTETAASAAVPVYSLARADGLMIVLDTPKGRGIFSTRFIPKDTVVEVCPVVILSEEEVVQHTSKTSLQHYTYYWPTSDGRSTTQALALGLGSMFNHSRSRPNVVWSRNIDAQCIVYTAHRDIQEGEELCISYGNARLWFKDVDDHNANDDYQAIEASNTRRGSTTEIELSGLVAIDL